MTAAVASGASEASPNTAKYYLFSLRASCSTARTAYYIETELTKNNDRRQKRRR